MTTELVNQIQAARLNHLRTLADAGSAAFQHNDLNKPVVDDSVKALAVALDELTNYKLKEAEATAAEAPEPDQDAEE